MREEGREEASPGIWPSRRVPTVSQAARSATQECGLIETVHLHAIYHTCCRYRVTAAPPEIRPPGSLIWSIQRPGVSQVWPRQEPYRS